MTEHFWKSLWEETFGAYVCEHCGLLPKDCLGKITIGIEWK